MHSDNSCYNSTITPLPDSYSKLISLLKNATTPMHISIYGRMHLLAYKITKVINFYSYKTKQSLYRKTIWYV